MAKSFADVRSGTPRERRTQGFRYQEIPDKLIEAPNLTRGMYVDVPRDEIPLGAAEELKNGRVRDEWAGRRPGTQEVLAKPNSEKVCAIFSYISKSGDRKLVRITPDSLHVTETDDAWTAYTNPLSSDDEKYNGVQFVDWLFTTDGRNKIRYIDFSAGEMFEIDEAPKARYITTFAERIVAGYVANPVDGWLPTGLQWCANADPFEWDQLDEDDELTGAGNENLVSFGDHITGLFGFTHFMFVLRLNSIWIAERQPIATSPFRFRELISGIGCDIPYSAVKAEDSVIFASQDQKGIFVVSPGQRPQRISKPVDSEIFSDFLTVNQCEGAWDPVNREYHFGVDNDDDGVMERVWVWNLEKNAWVFDDSPEITTIGLAVLPESATTIDELAGSSIDGLSPTAIDDLSSRTDRQLALMKGTASGEVLEQVFDAEQDYDGNFEFTFQSQDLGLLARRATMKDLLISIFVSNAGSGTLEHSNDGVNWNHSKSITLGASTSEQTIGLPKTSITGNRLFWRLRASSSDVRLLEYWVRVLQKFAKRQD